MGPDFNMRQCFEMASGEFRWWVGDDDRILPGALTTISEYLKVPNLLLIRSNVVPNPTSNIEYSTKISTDPHEFLLHGGGKSMSFGSTIVKAGASHDRLQLNWAMGTYHYYACYIWALIGDFGESQIPMVFIQSSPLIHWNFSRNKWYMSRLWEVLYVRTHYYPHLLHPYFDPIKPKLQQ